ncbi:MAG: mechanosensitive ion channel [Chlorobi bacterium]|nr:mechanosensitive ion channel [Chlorobiota bacterium]
MEKYCKKWQQNIAQSDIMKVEQVLLECAGGYSNISKINKPYVRLSNFGDSSLDFQLYFWTKNTFRVENIKSKLRFDIVKKFRENNIEIPFPQNDIHIKNEMINKIKE